MRSTMFLVVALGVVSSGCEVSVMGGQFPYGCLH